MAESSSFVSSGSRRTLVAVVVCLFFVVGGVGVVVAVDDVPGSDRLPTWSEVSPSLEIDEPVTEQFIHEGINDARQDRNLRALSLDEELTAVARNHSEDMASRGFFNHTTPNGIGPETRVRRAGAECTAVSENIVELQRNNHEEPLAENAVEAWLNSPGHLMNIVAENWTRTGIGVYTTDDNVYVTQLFCS
ncbi:CAP domain-containing protein [Halovenus rubra]|uniref:CAP domain-containing protein n=2 Tax=Halovenus rubra TaxID=869890 RepID=A0ABD5X4Z0_9EURY|nr:CAP domain-containing protein [Halovenus rubra]